MSVDMTVSEIQLCYYYQLLLEFGRRIFAVKPYKCMLSRLVFDEICTVTNYKGIDRTKVFSDKEYQSKQKGYRKVCNILSTLEFQFAHGVTPNLSSHKNTLCTPVGIARPSTTLLKTDRMNTNL